MAGRRALAVLVAATLVSVSLVLLGFPADAQNPTSIDLWGDASKGWGTSSTSLTNPGPPLTIDANRAVTFNLHSADGTGHTLWIDLNDNGNADTGEVSQTFTSTGTFPVNTSASGSHTYKCTIHPLTMTGTINIVGGGGGLSLALIVGIVIAVVVVLAIVAVVMMRRRGPPK